MTSLSDEQVKALNLKDKKVKMKSNWLYDSSIKLRILKSEIAAYQRRVDRTLVWIKGTEDPFTLSVVAGDELDNE